MEWQDISTSPKDGKMLLLYGGFPEIYGRSDHWMLVGGWDFNNWTTTDGDVVWPPSHWMTLPPPPNANP